MTPMRSTLAATALAALAACSGAEDIAVEDRPADVLYAEAEASLSAGNDFSAAREFAEVERLYPYSSWAKRATIMSAFAYYQAREFQQSRAAAERYLELYPTDEDAAYAQYLIAMGHYDQIVDVGRDQQTTIDALQAMRVLLERYPESDYAREIELKFDLALDHLAGKEMEIGRYYLKRGHYMAAVNRFQTVVDDYQTSTHTEEALHRMVEAYLALGLDSEAERAAGLLAVNFPGSDWYEDSYALVQSDGAANASGDDAGRLGRFWRRVVRGEWL